MKYIIKYKLEILLIVLYVFLALLAIYVYNL